MSSLANYKKKSSSIETLTKALADSQKKFQTDERFWQPTVDKAGNGFAIIRFLDTPEADGEDGLPFIKYYAHGFEGPGGWYIENSLTTVREGYPNGQNDPASEFNTKLWKSGLKANRDIASKQKRKLYYVSNIRVVSDAEKPENNGKIFLFRFGKKIFDKIDEKLNPPQDKAGNFMEEPMNPFHLIEGANFKLTVRKVGNFRNYDQSSWATPSKLAPTDKEIEAIWSQAYSLKEVFSKLEFKTYDELKARLDTVLGFKASEKEIPVEETAESATASEPGLPFTPNDGKGPVVEESSDDAQLEAFRKMAEES